MSNQVIRKRRTTTSLSNITATLGEIFIDITKPTLIVHDGIQAGGFPLAHEVHTHPVATTLTSGFMSNDDKSKLDALQVGGGIQNILLNTVPISPENTMNFSTDFSVVNNSNSSRIDVGVSSSLMDTINGDIIALVVALG
jgi:hypothetical protein